MRKIFTLTLNTVITVCFTIVFVYIFTSLWQYRLILGAVIFVSIYIGTLVWVAIIARARLVEQVLRMERYRYREEIPLGYNPPVPTKRASREKYYPEGEEF
jgi:hypothetical protein